MSTPKVGDTVYFIDRGVIVAKQVLKIQLKRIIVKIAGYGAYLRDFEYGFTPEECKQNMLTYKNRRLVALKKKMDKLEKDIDKIHKIKTDV